MVDRTESRLRPLPFGARLGITALLVVLAGLAALLAVEVRELPDVDRPVVSVRVDFPGASPETMDSEVISLLEGAAARGEALARQGCDDAGHGRIHEGDAKVAGDVKGGPQDAEPNS